MNVKGQRLLGLERVVSGTRSDCWNFDAGSSRYVESTLFGLFTRFIAMLVFDMNVECFGGLDSVARRDDCNSDEETGFNSSA